MKKRFETARPPVTMLQGWAARLANHVGIDETAAAVLPDDLNGWADMLAVLKRENAELYTAAQQRLQLTDKAIETATNARYAA